MSEVVPLAIWCADEEQDTVDFQRIRAAKAALGLAVRCVPEEQWEGTIADRVLAWGSRPPFLCDYVLVSPATSDDELQSAIAWILHEREDPTAMTVEDCLKVLMGPEVRELTPAELEGERRFADYQAGRA